MPWYRCRSEPQIAASCTRTIASLGCSIRGLSFSSTRSLYGPRYVIARMVCLPGQRTRLLRFPAASARKRPRAPEAARPSVLEHDVVPGPSVEHVDARAAEQHVVAGAAEQRVVAGAPDEGVLVVTAVRREPQDPSREAR